MLWLRVQVHMLSRMLSPGFRGNAAVLTVMHIPAQVHSSCLAQWFRSVLHKCRIIMGHHLRSLARRWRVRWQPVGLLLCLFAYGAELNRRSCMSLRRASVDASSICNSTHPVFHVSPLTRQMFYRVAVAFAPGAMRECWHAAIGLLIFGHLVFGMHVLERLAWSQICMAARAAFLLRRFVARNVEFLVFFANCFPLAPLREMTDLARRPINASETVRALI